MEHQRRGDSFDTSQCEHFVTAKKLAVLLHSSALTDYPIVLISEYFTLRIWSFSVGYHPLRNTNHHSNVKLPFSGLQIATRLSALKNSQAVVIGSMPLVNGDRRQAGNLPAILQSTETTFVQIVYTPLKSYFLYYTDTTMVTAHIFFSE